MILEIHNVLFFLITQIYLQCPSHLEVCLFVYMYIYWMTLNLPLCIFS